jgi:hypothetical protein
MLHIANLTAKQGVFCRTGKVCPFGKQKHHQIAPIKTKLTKSNGTTLKMGMKSV